MDWYADNGRIAVSPDRDTAIDATVAGWAADIGNGNDAAMYAWRRANVAELNRRGREAWDGLGRLSGPELVVGDIGYRAGDRIVTLAPGAKGEIVTSECGTVDAVDVARRQLGATMDDGRFQLFVGEDLGASHLAHGYAVTVHRSQGATTERAHALEDGGGRELAYVKMSRAKECSTVYVVADSLEQAVEDLGRSWSQSRRIGWAVDRGIPSHDPPAMRAAKERDGTVEARFRRARLMAEREALGAVIPVDPGFARNDAERRVQRLERALEHLDRANGDGDWKGTPVGEAAAAWQGTLREWRSCMARAEDARPLERHRLHRQADRAAEQEGPMREQFERLATPERARLEAELSEAKGLFEELHGGYAGRVHFSVAHPEALRRLDYLDHEITKAEYELGRERQGLDGIAPERPEPPQPSRELVHEIEGPDLGLSLF